ncbi:MAG: hypothetical protein AAF559_07175 [Pseudomonadota bacterium]
MNRAMSDILTQWALASDAMRISAVGTGFWLLAALAALMEWRRNRSRSLERLEKVGWVPWTPIFMACAMIGGGCLAMGLPALLAEG